MAMLHLLRHAKSKEDREGEDFERGLSGRGVASARRVGATLPAVTGALDLVLCSGAKRTRETMDLVLAGYEDRPQVLVEDELYLANCPQLLRRLSRLPDAAQNVLVIGHNPGLRDLTVALAATDSPAYPLLADSKFPAAARASFRIDTRWSALGSTRHTLLDYVPPRSLAAED